MSRTVVYIHGVGGATPLEEWLNPLNVGLAQAGAGTIDRALDRVISVVYQPLLLLTEQPATKQAAPEETWHKSDSYDDDADQFALRQDAMARFVRRWGHKHGLINHSLIPLAISSSLAAGISLLPALKEARTYATNRSVRNEVLRDVMAQLPTSGSVVIIAHSLGSVIATDLLTRLPEGLTVDLLVTMGSPLAGKMWRHNSDLRDAFPASKVGAWVNIFDRDDPITYGRGISERFPQAIDVPVSVRTHWVRGYAGHPVLGAVVGRAFDAGFAPPSPAAPAKALSQSWNYQLLGFAFADQISRTCKPTKFDWRRRFDYARAMAAGRVIDEAAAAETPGPRPSESELLERPAELIHGVWSDDELIPLISSMVTANPVAPFDIEVKESHRVEALTSLLGRIRRDDDAISDANFLRAITESIDSATAELTPNRRRWWGYLMGGGALVLAATGVGLALALPAALAGAAAITATLAAFGPGGMVGGMLTLVLATGAGTGLIGAGAAAATAGQSPDARVQFAVAEALVKMPLEELRAVLIGVVAVIRVQEALDLPSTAGHSAAALSEAIAQLSHEATMHEALAPGRPGTKDLQARVKVIRQALDLVTPTDPKALEGSK